jgi:hypothetical protein
MCGHHDLRASRVLGPAPPRQHIFGRNIMQRVFSLAGAAHSSSRNAAAVSPRSVG